MPQLCIEIPDSIFTRVALVAQESSRTPEEVLEDWLHIPLSLYDENDAAGSRQLLEKTSDGLCIKGTRIQIEHVLEQHLFKGQSIEQIAREFELAPELVAAAVSYFHANPVECMGTLASFFAWREDFEQGLERRKVPGLKARLSVARKP